MLRLVVGIALAAAPLLALAAGAPEPDWVRRPTPGELLSVWPTAARANLRGGSAVINCLITAERRLWACDVASESPEGEGFGAAAIALSPELRIQPAVIDGKVVERRIDVPLAFRSTDLGPMLKDDRDRVFSHLPWIQAPGYADVVAAYPPAARASRTSGRVMLSCRVRLDARLEKCRPVLEEPRDMGFAQAGVALADRFVAAPLYRRKGERPISALVPIAFDAALLDGPPVLRKPIWNAVPTPLRLQAAVEDFAKPGVAARGRASMHCIVTADGGLAECKVLKEEPADLRLGAVTLSLAPDFKVALWGNDGVPVTGAVVVVPMRYDLAAPPSTDGPKP